MAKKRGVTAEISSIVEKKFEELKASILTQFVGEINRAVEEGISSIN